MTNWAIWALMLALGLATYAMRAAFLVGWKRPLPPALQQVLRFVPPAVLAALALPTLASAEAAFSLPRLMAGVVGIVVAGWSAARPAWRSKGVLLTVVSGMSALWALTLVHL
jgi:branched-subunit amino acid transport protein